MPVQTTLTMDGARPVALDDAHSDRIRCDHPPRQVDGAELGQALLELAVENERGRVLAMAHPDVAEGLGEAGFAVEGIMPGFYAGEAPCVVMGAFPDASRQNSSDPAAVEKVQSLLGYPRDARRVEVETVRANAGHADELAELLDQTFAQYPTPSADLAYVRQAIDEGVPFRFVEDDGQVVACASADLVREARTAELTDCATLPTHRGRGYMQAILSDLMNDLRDLNYCSAFTMARAEIPGVNLAFERLQFDLCGTMTRSCRIGDGLEDMNLWSRRLSADS